MLSALFTFLFRDKGYFGEFPPNTPFHVMHFELRHSSVSVLLPFPPSISYFNLFPFFSLSSLGKQRRLMLKSKGPREAFEQGQTGTRFFVPFPPFFFSPSVVLISLFPPLFSPLFQDTGLGGFHFPPFRSRSLKLTVPVKPHFLSFSGLTGKLSFPSFFFFLVNCGGGAGCSSILETLHRLRRGSISPSLREKEFPSLLPLLQASRHAGGQVDIVNPLLFAFPPSLMRKESGPFLSPFFFLAIG